MTFVLRWQSRHQQAIHAYRARLGVRLTRVEEDVAWARRGPAVIHALMLAEEKRRALAETWWVDNTQHSLRVVPS